MALLFLSYTLKMDVASSSETVLPVY